MKLKMMAFAIVGIVLGSLANAAQAQEFNIMQGDERSACEAVLCLAAGGGPSECTPPLRRYFSITATKPSDLRKKRRNFLNLCPNQDPQMIDSLVNGDCNPAFQQCGPGGGHGPGRPEPEEPIQIQ